MCESVGCEAKHCISCGESVVKHTRRAHTHTSRGTPDVLLAAQTPIFLTNPHICCFCFVLLLRLPARSKAPPWIP
jgi:hypothetical protein